MASNSEGDNFEKDVGQEGVSKSKSGVNSPDAPPRVKRFGSAWWSRLGEELGTFKREKQKRWGGISESTLGRYEEGTLTPWEEARVEKALETRPFLRENLKIVDEIMHDVSEPEMSSLKNVDPKAETSHRLREEVRDSDATKHER